MTRSLVTYVASAICCFIALGQARYFVDYFADPENPVRLENLEGILLLGILSLVAWVPLVVLSSRSPSSLPARQRWLALVAGSAVGIGTVSALLIDLAM
jgi:hypothetical protein